jgi:hypothetical protein
MPSSTDFNAICYVARYPDVKKTGIDPFQHWQKYGLSEGRVCGCDLPGTIYSAKFNSSAYLSRYPDILQSSIWKSNPIGHYQAYGIYEGRHPGYEILSTTSPIGMVSPGTTTTTPDDITINQAPGDNQVPVVTDVSGNTIDPNTGKPVPVVDTNINDDPSTGTSSFMDFIKNNSTMVAAGAALIIILLHENKKKKK